MNNHDLFGQELLEDFLYPASRLMANYNSTGELLPALADPICTTSASVVAALDLLVALSAGCVANMKLLTNMLSDMFFSGTEQQQSLIKKTCAINFCVFFESY